MKSDIKKILIADDDASIVDSITMILEMQGFDVASTLDGSLVNNYARKHTDLILLDIWMCGYDGRDICRQLKSNAETKDIPVLMISASRDVKQSAFDAGADDFLEKPFEMNKLISKVDQLTQ